VLRADQPVPTPAAAVVDVFINALNLSPHQAFTSAAYSSAASSHPKWDVLRRDGFRCVQDFGQYSDRSRTMRRNSSA
jgi:hypothetical protein